MCVCVRVCVHIYVHIHTVFLRVCVLLNIAKIFIYILKHRPQRINVRSCQWETQVTASSEGKTELGTTLHFYFHLVGDIVQPINVITYLAGVLGKPVPGFYIKFVKLP